MKNYVFLYITIVSAFLYSVHAQKTEVFPVVKKVQETQTVSKTNSTDVKIYHVEENINNKFGGRTTTYDVLDPNHINTTDLGPNNTRVVTPRFTKEEKIIPKNKPEIIQEKVQVIEPIPKEEHNDYAFVFMIKTYERIAEKGYKSVEMFQKLGNSYFFNSEMKKAARWYCELFEMSTDLDSEYYYRYAKSLNSIGENDKANEILAKFNQKNSKQ